MSDDDAPLGELLLRSLGAVPCPAWSRAQIDEACVSGRVVGLGPLDMLRLLDRAKVGSVIVTAPAVRRAYTLTVRRLDAILRECGFSIQQRRAVLGFPPSG